MQLHFFMPKIHSFLLFAIFWRLRVFNVETRIPIILDKSAFDFPGKLLILNSLKNSIFF